MTEPHLDPTTSCVLPGLLALASRRSLLKAAAALGGAMAITQMFGDAMMQATFAGTPGGNTLVVISLRGGIDGLGVVVPHGDPGYYKARPTTAVPQPRCSAPTRCSGCTRRWRRWPALWDSKRARRHPGHRPPRRQPVALRRHRGGRGRRPRLDSLRTGWINRMIGSRHQRAGTARRRPARHELPDHRDDRRRARARHRRPRRPPGHRRSTATPTQRYASLQPPGPAPPAPLAAGAGEAVAISKGPGQTLTTHAGRRRRRLPDASGTPPRSPSRSRTPPS